VLDEDAAVQGKLTSALSGQRIERPAQLDEKGSKTGTMTINQWAADAYPIEQKHLDAARTLENAINK